MAEATESSLAMLILDIPAAAASNSTSRGSDSIDTSYAVIGGHGLSRVASRGDRRVWNQKLAGGTTVRSILIYPWATWGVQGAVISGRRDRL